VSPSISRRRLLAAAGASGALAPFRIAGAAARPLSTRDVTLPPFGAAGDGETDDTAAIQQAIDDAAREGGGTVLLPPGRYLVSRPLRVDASHIHIVGTPGRTVMTKKAPTRYIDVGGAHRLARSSAIAVTEPAGVGGLSLRVQPGAPAGRLAESWVVVLAGKQESPGDPKRLAGSRYAAQFVYVRAEKDGRLELNTPLRIACSPESGEKVVPVEWLKGFRMHGIAFDGVDKLVGRALNQSNVLTLDWCLEPVVSAVEAWDIPNLFISLEGCLRADVSDVTCRNTLSYRIDGPERGYGYAVVERGLNEGALISRVKADRVRHAYTTSSSRQRIGEPHGSRIAHSVAMASRGAGFDTHPIGEGIAFINCAVLGSLHVGFQVRASGSQIIGCSASDCQGSALQIHFTAADTQVSSFVGRRTGFGRFEQIDWATRGAINDRGARTTVLGAQLTDCAGPGLQLDDGGDDAIYRSVRVTNPAQSDAASPGVRLRAKSLTEFMMESCVVSSDKRQLDAGYEVDAPNLVQGVMRGCVARNAAQTVKGASPRLRIVA
jgi:hypothetical protein